MNQWIDHYKNASTRLILLDYDGTLTNYTSVPAEAKLSSQIEAIIRKLNEIAGTEVVIITGREYQDIDRLVGHLPIKIIAEHGAMAKDGGKWKVRTGTTAQWKSIVLPFFDEAVCNCTGSFVEEKRFCLTWHYRNSDQIVGYNYSRDLMNRIEEATQKNGLRVIDGAKVVEVLRKEINKGKATLDLLRNSSYDLVLSIGDDKTDEDMFEVLTDDKKHMTIKVGQGQTSARYSVGNTADVALILEGLLL